MKNKLIYLLFIFTLPLWAANPEVVNGVATYSQNITIGSRFKVPDSWNKIVIKAGVQINGNFIIAGAKRTFTIQGEGWSSILDNSITEYVKKDRSLCNIRFENHGKLILKDFMSRNPANFHITAWAPIEMDGMKIIENRRRTSTDAAHSNFGVKIINSFLSTYDDVLYVGEAEIVENTIIEHNRNGGPAMVSWGGNAHNNKTTFKNVTFIDNETSDIGYAHGIVGWAQKFGNTFERPIVEFINTRWITKQGKDASPDFYSFGNNSYTVTNVEVHQIGGLCSWATKIRQRNGSNGKVTTENCKQSYSNDDGANVQDPAMFYNSSSSQTSPSSSSNNELDPIEDLSATPLSCNQIKLEWSEIIGAESYRIRRKIEGESIYTNLLDIDFGISEYLDNSTIEKTKYIYQVRPVVNNIAVQNSNIVEVLTPQCDLITSTLNAKTKVNSNRVRVEFEEKQIFIQVALYDIQGNKSPHEVLNKGDQFIVIKNSSKKSGQYLLMIKTNNGIIWHNIKF